METGDGDKEAAKDTLMVTVGHKLRVARERTGLRQEDVAAKLGISRAAYSHIERGLNSLQIAHIPQLLEILQVGVLDILPDDFITLRDRPPLYNDSRLVEIIANWEKLPEFLKDGLVDIVKRYVKAVMTRLLQPRNFPAFRSCFRIPA